MYKSKLKQLTIVLTSVSLIGQSVLLTGCVGGSGNSGSSAASPSNLKSKLKSNDPSSYYPSAQLDDHRLWGNMRGFDTTYHNSQLDLSINNNSMNNLENVGCATSYSDGHTEFNGPDLRESTGYTILAGQQAPRTKKFDSKWAAYADSDNAILDSKHVADYALYTYSDGTDVSQSCYYRVYQPQAGDFLYFKLKTQTVKLPTNGKSTLGQPDTDIQQISGTDVGKALANKQLSIKQLTTPIAWSNQHDSQLSMDDYVNNVISVQLHNHVNLVNQFLIKNNKGTNKLVGDPIIDLRNQNLQELLDYYFGIKPTDGSNIFYSQIEAADIIKYEDGKYGINIIYKYKDGGERAFSSAIKNDREILRTIAWADGVPLEDNLTPNSGVFTEPADELVADYASTYGALPKSPNNAFIMQDSQVGKLVYMSNTNPRYNEFDDQYVPMAEADATAVDVIETGAASATKLTGKYLAGGIVLSAAATATYIYGIYSLIEWLENNSNGADSDDKGNHHANINMVTIEPVTSAEASAWNQANPNNPIAANSKVSYLNPDLPNGGNNSLSQTVNVTFNDNRVDSQTGVKVALSSIDSPWRRSSAQTEDPYLGSLYYYPNTGEGNRDDAIVGMDISDINDVSPIKDAEYNYMSENFANKGLGSLAQDNRYQAPTYNVAQVVNLKTGKLAYASGMNGGVYAKNNGMLKINDITGLAVNSGMKTTLNVQLPSSGANGNSYGLGLGTYMVLDDGESANFTPIMSDMLLSGVQHSESAMPYFYSKFNCSFPTKVGTTCPLDLMIGGVDKSKHMGKLFVADGASKTTTIPLYLNYKLVEDSNASPNIPAGSQSTISIKLANWGDKNYQQINVSGLPEGAYIDSSSTCNNGLATGQQCNLVVNISQVTDTGNMIIYGTSTGSTAVPDVNSPDAVGYALNISGGA